MAKKEEKTIVAEKESTKEKPTKEKTPKEKISFGERVSRAKKFFVSAYRYVRKMLDIRNRRNWLTILGNIVVYALIIVISFIFIQPIFELLMESFQDVDDIRNPGVHYIALAPTFNTYISAFNGMDYLTSLIKALLYNGGLAAVEMLVAAVTAYAFARYDFSGKKLWFAILIVSFVLPSSILLLARQLLFYNTGEIIGIGLINTFIPISLMTLFGQGVFSAILILIFYNFFKQIPYDLDEAAFIDGASSMQVFYHIILKLSIPIIFTVFLFAFVWNWNETTTSVVLLKDSYYEVSMVGTLQNYSETLINQNTRSTENKDGYLSAATILSILPLVLLYAVVQRKFIEGIEQSGITGV